MRGARKLVLVLAVAALLANGLAACGGSGSGDSTAGSTAASTRETTASTIPEDRSSGKGEKERGGGADKGSSSGSAGDGSSADEVSSSFRTPGGDNSIQNFGEEADASEVDAASAALAGYLRARSEDDWAGQCPYLAKAAVAPLEELASRSPQFKGKGCAAVLSGLMAGSPKSTRANTMSDGIASLRFEGDRGFALYHGAHGVDYFVPMVKEDGEWKVGALAPTEFP